MPRGVSSPNHVDEDLPCSAPSTPKSQKKNKQSSACNKNPYSSRGLEKFNSVLSDLEARKEKIMAKKGLSESPRTMVRFMYSNSQDWIPVIVRLKEENNITTNNKSNPSSPKKLVPAQPKPKELSSAPPTSPKEAAAPQEKKLKKRVTWIEGGKKRVEWWKLRPSYSMLMLMLLILVCLVVFGRVFAICCTAVWWYLVPCFNGGDESVNMRKRSASKDYVRKLSDKRLSAAAGGVGVQELGSPRANVSHGKRG